MNASPLPASLAVGLDDAIFALAGALDLVGVDEVAHGRRVAAAALACARVLGWGERQRSDLMHAALLHDCGVSTTTAHRAIVDGGLGEPGPEALEHCERGSASLASLPRLAPLAPVVRLHHTPWRDMPVVPERLAEMANLVFLADRVDVLRLRAPTRSARVLRDRVIAVLASRADLFAPRFLDALAEAARPEAFWYSLDDRYVDEALRDRRPRGDAVPLALEDLRGLARIFACIVDVKSRFTLRHSEGVSMLARRLAEDAGWSPGQCVALEIAGFFHDIGKLGVPDAILEKAGPLDGDERDAIKRHPFDSYRILRRMFPESPVARWAAYHHEWVSGRGGYPFGVSGVELDAGSRFVAAADVAQAFLQTRPYRKGLPPEEVVRRLRGLVEIGQLDGDAVGGVERILVGVPAASPPVG